MVRVTSLAAVIALTALPALAGPQDFFKESSKDFGTTARGSVLVHYFPVTNTSKETITLGQARVSCGCVAAQVLKYTLAPGESTAVMAEMHTRRIPRSYQSWKVTVFVPIQTSTIWKEAQMTVEATARDDMFMSNGNLAMGTIPMGKGATASTKITLNSDANWTLSEPTSTGKFVKPEVKLVSRNGSEVTYEVTAKLLPECPHGNWTAEVFLKSSHSSFDKLRVPLTVNVVPAIQVNAEALMTPGDVKVGSPFEKQIKLESKTPFKVLKVSGADEVVTVQGTDGEAKPVHTLTIKVNPKNPGSLIRTLEVQTDLKEQPKVEVPFKLNAVK
jgi:hypothetical protein